MSLHWSLLNTVEDVVKIVSDLSTNVSAGHVPPIDSILPSSVTALIGVGVGVGLGAGDGAGPGAGEGAGVGSGVGVGAGAGAGPGVGAGDGAAVAARCGNVTR